MNPPVQLSTDRLILRPLRDSDLEPLGRITADPRVMPDLPAPPQSEALVQRNAAHFAAHGFGLWAVEAAGRAPFVGLAGLWQLCGQMPVGPCVEIGWRLDPSHWGRGYATEAATALLAFAFRTARLDEVVGFTVDHNHRSRRVMEKLGMRLEVLEPGARPGRDGQPIETVTYGLALLPRG